MTTTVELPASSLLPFDGISEGTIIKHVRHHEIEQQNPLTGEVLRRPAITVELGLAQIVAVDVFEGEHLHEFQPGIVDERTFEPNEMVRVARPGPVASCRCGKT